MLGSVGGRIEQSPGLPDSSERGNEAFFHGSVRVRNPGMDITQKL